MKQTRKLKKGWLGCLFRVFINSGGKEKLKFPFQLRFAVSITATANFCGGLLGTCMTPYGSWFATTLAKPSLLSSAAPYALRMSLWISPQGPRTQKMCTIRMLRFEKNAWDKMQMTAQTIGHECASPALVSSGLTAPPTTRHTKQCCNAVFPKFWLLTLHCH